MIKTMYIKNIILAGLFISYMSIIKNDKYFEILILD